MRQQTFKENEMTRDTTFQSVGVTFTTNNPKKQQQMNCVYTNINIKKYQYLYISNRIEIKKKRKRI